MTEISQQMKMIELFRKSNKSLTEQVKCVTEISIGENKKAVVSFIEFLSFLKDDYVKTCLSYATAIPKKDSEQTRISFVNKYGAFSELASILIDHLENPNEKIKEIENLISENNDKILIASTTIHNMKKGMENKNKENNRGGIV